MPRPLVLLASLLALLALLASGCARPATLDEAQRWLRAGELGRACPALARLAESGSRARQLEALRGWIDCLARSGELERAERWLAARPADGARAYGEALLAVARTPAALPQALALLEEASRRWPAVAELPYRAAVLLLADEQPAPALALLDRACRLEATAACAVARAHALLDLGREEEALAEVARVPRLQPRRADVTRGRALIQRLARRRAAVPEAARERFRRARELLDRHDRPGEALRVLEELLVDHPRLGAAHSLVGLAQLKLGNGADAVVALRRAAELDPLDATNPLFLGVLYQTRGRAAEAIEAYRRALRLDPFLARAAQRLGELLLRGGRAAEAAEVLEAARAVEADALSLRLAARAHLAAGALERAEECFSRLLREEPRDFEGNLRLAQLLIDRHQKRRGPRELATRAARLLDVAAEARPGDPELMQLRARLWRTE